MGGRDSFRSLARAPALFCETKETGDSARRNDNRNVEWSFGQGASGGPKSECLDPTFDRRAEPNAQNIIVARELPTINDRALQAKPGRGRNEHHFLRLPRPLRDQLNPYSADILRGNYFKNSRLVKACKPQKRV